MPEIKSAALRVESAEYAVKAARGIYTLGLVLTVVLTAIIQVLQTARDLYPMEENQPLRILR